MRSYLVAVLLSVSGLLCAADPVIDQIFADPPVAVSDVSTGVVEDIALPIPAATLLANDTDAQIDTLSVVGASSALGGTATVAAGVLAFTSARNTTGADTLTYHVVDQSPFVSTVPRTVLATTVAGAVVTYDSGYGSALAMKPGTTDEFYLMTDRGPNIDGASGSKVFVDPTFNPNIGHFRMLADGSLERLKVFGKRRANRGMEGLTTTPDGSTLVGIMQSPLYNPTSVAISGSRICRILC